uniref:Uncharacterized protein n=1 Tax=Anguilla anguilla TaxID=7936 RepID=A0A0E9TA15_ANGAN
MFIISNSLRFVVDITKWAVVLMSNS